MLVKYELTETVDPARGFRLYAWDMWGWVAYYLRHVELMLTGSLQEFVEYNNVPPLNDPRLRANPEFKHEMHCVFLALPYGFHNEKTFPEITANLKVLRSGVLELYKVPVIVLLTQCDKATDVADDLSDFFGSVLIDDARTAVAKSLGMEPSDVLPVATVYGLKGNACGRIISHATLINSWSICLDAFRVALDRTTDFLDNVASGAIKRNNFGLSTEP